MPFIKKPIYVVCFAFLIFGFSSCKKDPPAISDVPAIEFVSITPTQAKEYSDKITITFSYKDGNGDLGENNPNVKNVFVTDNRNQVTYTYRLSQLAPDGSSISIQGHVNIEINNTGIIDGSGSQDVAYSLYMIDRAGNESNHITTTTIKVVK